MRIHSSVIITMATQMYECPHPSSCQVRVSRHWLQRILYSEVYHCTACGGHLGIHHRYLSALFVNNFRFIFSRYSHCVSCGSSAIDRGGRAHLLSKNPLGWIQLLAAAPLRECSPCGRQYFDWRPARPLRSDTAVLNRTARDLAALNRAIPPQHGVQELERTSNIDTGE
jgi:hypothetical protein